MKTRPLSKKDSSGRFAKLIDDISRMYTSARQAQVRFAWETGKRIVTEEQSGALRAAYGTHLIAELSKALSQKFGPGFSERNLQRMRHFYTRHPIAPLAAELKWSGYAELLPVKDAKTRRQLERRAAKENLTRHEIRRLVRQAQRGGDNGPAPTPAPALALPPLKRPTGLKLHTFALSPLRVSLKEGYTLVDCGFFVSWPVKKEELKGLDLSGMDYTYAATVDRVIDGDTLLVLIEAGFGIIVRDRLRLRGVNCPEKGTPEGDRAFKFAQKCLPAGASIILRSRKCKTDMYGRFVADVFFLEGVTQAPRLLNEGVYLNQHLLDHGHAERMAE